MSFEALQYLLTQRVQVPFEPGKVSKEASFIVLCSMAWHADLDGFAWPSDRTQEQEIPLSRSQIWVARQLFEAKGWLIYTGQRKQKGVKVYKLVLPGFVFSGSTVQITKTDTSGLASGSDSGSDSGSPSGLQGQAEKEININEKNANEISKHKNETNYIPKDVREGINRNKRSRGIYSGTSQSDVSLGEAVKEVFNGLQKLTTDEEPF